jgi:tetratricopeptide (TPR) repeat protein
VLVLAAVILLLGKSAHAAAQPVSGAWERWGITKPVADPAAEPLFVAAYGQLYSGEYDSARISYAELVRKYPESAEAHLGLSMAERYLNFTEPGKAWRESAFVEVKKARELDPDAAGVLCDYADLFQPGRGPYKTGPQADSERCAVSIEAATRAAKTEHRYATYAHVSLWICHMHEGRLADARREMKFLFEQGYFHPMLLDFGRNLMTGLPADAILFTNGDNDTEPLYCVQAGEEFRPDVLVVNGTFLGLPKLMAAMRDSLKLPLTLTDKELAAKPKWGDVRDNIVKKAFKQNRPVYFAATFAPDNIGDWQDHLIDEGLFRRVVPVKTGDSLDAARTAENVKSWRLANAGQRTNWITDMSPMTRHIDELNLNYASVCVNLAQYSQKHGDTAKAEAMCRQAYNLVEQWDDGKRTAQLAGLWLSLNPNSREGKELNKQLAEQGKDFTSRARADMEKSAAAQAATACCSVMFRTKEPAPASFDRWTCFWVHPGLSEGAKVGYEVRSGTGQVYFNWGPFAVALGDSARSDFWKELADPKMLFGRDIVLKFWTDKDKLEFPPDFVPWFEFYKDGQTIKRVAGVRLKP